MSAKLLSMKKPALNTYNLYASLLSLIGPEENAWSWVMNHFIQIVRFNSYQTYFFDTHRLLYHHCPWVDAFCIPKSMIGTSDSSLSGFIKEQLERDTYLWLSADQYYLSASPLHQKHHFVHELFLFGYDERQNIVHIADHFKDGRYEHAVCSFDELEQAFRSSYAQGKFADQVYLFSKHMNMQDEFNAEQVYFLLDAYLNAKDTFHYNKSDNCMYGVAALEQLPADLLRLVEGTHADLRPFQLLWERSELMASRIQYMNLRLQLDADNRLLRTAMTQKNAIQAIRNLLTKFNLSGNEVLLNRSQSLLRQYIEEEKRWIPELMTAVSRTIG
ncbi:hypothetical protein DNH61_24055 [Paenibacillus sambharensis]|uniref:Butirosin biosynthesis protein H N-terminal domain-containing protein n=1 Tax=Paenibacillus sambharensis TaxID=1803190 RepID=A0A2W1L473_9BACL|nr:hypothetical protein [Paenibacillus sambharensis]PZD93689.1 hypothetical protein DNH61_24055 [Paenibacillus sambharensis]